MKTGRQGALMAAPAAAVLIGVAVVPVLAAAWLSLHRSIVVFHEQMNRVSQPGDVSLPDDDADPAAAYDFWKGRPVEHDHWLAASHRLHRHHPERFLHGRHHDSGLRDPQLPDVQRFRDACRHMGIRLRKQH